MPLLVGLWPDQCLLIMAGQCRTKARPTDRGTERLQPGSLLNHYNVESLLKAVQGAYLFKQDLKLLADEIGIEIRVDQNQANCSNVVSS